MSESSRVKNCVTHHYACDCREWQFDQLRTEIEELKAENERLKEAFPVVVDRIRIDRDKYKAMAMEIKSNIVNWSTYMDTYICETNCSPEVGHHEPECCIMHEMRDCLQKLTDIEDAKVVEVCATDLREVFPNAKVTLGWVSDQKMDCLNEKGRYKAILIIPKQEKEK